MKTFIQTCICAFLHVTNNLNAHTKYSNYKFEYLGYSQNRGYIIDDISKISYVAKHMFVRLKEILLDTAPSSYAVFSKKNKLDFFLKDATRLFKNDIDYSFRIGPAMKLENNLSYDLLYI